MEKGAKTRELVTCIGMGLVIGMGVATNWEKRSPDFWTFLSAVGTFAAAAIALGIAFLDGLRRRGEARRRAEVAAAGLSPLLSEVTKRVLDAGSMCELYVDDPDRAPLHLEEIRRTTFPSGIELITADLVALLPIPKVAGNIARAVALLRLLHADLDTSVIRNVFLRPEFGDTRKTLVASWHNRVRQAAALLVEANEACADWGTVHAASDIQI
ncbi:hypothetical protein [Cupriavidus sp.]|uniref:hypothetical protein n=1 Tax=Cupriavidus sp. TaxID=1873897 RepID=UPI0028BE9CDD|nr:hypothetical protein [Cupriavidus sp.]